MRAPEVPLDAQMRPLTTNYKSTMAGLDAVCCPQGVRPISGAGVPHPSSRINGFGVHVGDEDALAQVWGWQRRLMWQRSQPARIFAVFLFCMFSFACSLFCMNDSRARPEVVLERVRLGGTSGARTSASLGSCRTLNTIRCRRF